MDYTPNITDLQGLRYSYRNQPNAVMWNIAQLAEALVAAGLVPLDAANDLLEELGSQLVEEYNAGVAKKMGLKAWDQGLSLGLMRLMQEDGADFTNTYRALSAVPAAWEKTQDVPAALAAVLGPLDLSDEALSKWKGWLEQYAAALRAQGLPEEERVALQDAANPKYVLRNYLAQRAIEKAEQGDPSEVHTLLELLRAPYDEREGFEAYAEPMPKEMDRPGVTLLS